MLVAMRYTLQGATAGGTVEHPDTTMRVLPTLLRSFSTHNNAHSSQTKSLNNIINNTADRLVHGGFWKKIEPPVTRTPFENFVQSLQKFSNSCQAKAGELGRTSLEPIRVSCVEAYGSAVTQLHTGFETLATLTERRTLQTAASRQAACEADDALKKPAGVVLVDMDYTLNEHRPLRKSVISAVRVMADIILPPRNTYCTRE